MKFSKNNKFKIKPEAKIKSPLTSCCELSPLLTLTSINSYLSQSLTVILQHLMFSQKTSKPTLRFPFYCDEDPLMIWWWDTAIDPRLIIVSTGSAHSCFIGAMAPAITRLAFLNHQTFLLYWTVPSIPVAYVSNLLHPALLWQTVQSYVFSREKWLSAMETRFVGRPCASLTPSVG